MRRRAEDKFQEIKLCFNNLQLQSAGSTIKNREEYIKETMIEKKVLMYIGLSAFAVKLKMWRKGEEVI